MAISINWDTKVITVPKADTLLVQAAPTEIRQLDMDSFRLTLKDLEDDEEGMPFLNTHNHVAPINVGSVSLARVLEIINGYTVTFEDGQYAVNLVGANSNLADVTNVNQVSVRSANSAGLTYSKEVEDQSFSDARVWVDTVNGLPGTDFPRGTPGDPVSNLVDAKAIISNRNMPKRIFLRGSVTVGSTETIADYDILGSSAILATIDADTGANTDNLVVESLTIMGDLMGNLTARQSTSLTNLADFEGNMSNCGLDGSINISDNQTVLLDSCYSEIAGMSTPTITMGVNSTLIMRNYSGGIAIRNMTAGCVASVDLDPGSLILDNSNTGGELVARGVGSISDNSAGTSVLSESLVEGQRLQEVHKIHGLETGTDMVVTDTTRTAGTVSQTITEGGSSTTVSRS